MKFRARVILLLVGVLCSVHFTYASNSFGMDLLLSKLDFLQDKLQDIEQNLRLKDQSCQNTPKEVPIVKQDDDQQRDRLDDLERALKEIERTFKERDDNLHKKLSEFEIIFKTMDSTLKEVQLVMKETDRTVKELYKSTQAREVSLQEMTRIVKSTEADSRTRFEQLENKLIAKVNSSYQHTLQAAMQNFQNETKKITDLQTEFIRNQSKMVEVANNGLCRSAPKVSGTYDIWLAPGQFVKVYCEQVAFGGGWITFQHRFNGEVNFFRNWSEYRDGFGNPTGEFWLGLKYLHMLTSTRRHELLVEVRDRQGNYGYARYDDFSIENEGEGFKLKIGNYSGTAGDALTYQNGMKFSTKDRDNDNSADSQCAVDIHGAWWYNYCSHSNLNGGYKNVTDGWSSLHWQKWKRDFRPMAFTKMMLREVV